MFRLSKRSMSRLRGVDTGLVKVVTRAIQLTNIDFGVTEGLRTFERQQELVAAKASKTLKSKHIDGRAVDVAAYLGSRVSWELNLYDDIADAMKEAAIEYDVNIRWGAAWTVRDLRAWEGTMEEAMMSYIDTRRKQGRRPFIDACHFEIMS
jgi:peptidoglycan L-alanyl-D-glutamate endopeptidase CwlK